MKKTNLQPSFGRSVAKEGLVSGTGEPMHQDFSVGDVKRSHDYDRSDPPITASAWYPLRQLRKAIAQEIAAYRLDAPGSDIVDFGAGDAPYRGMFPQSTYRMADIAEAGHHTQPELAIVEGRVAVEDDCADIVVSFQVLEHVDDVALYLAEARRMIRPGGKLLLTTHGVWPYHPHPRDLWRWTAEGMAEEMTRNGFRPLTLRGVVGPLGWTDQIRMSAVRRAANALPIVGPVCAAILTTILNVKIAIEDGCTPNSIRQRDPAIIVVVAEPVQDGAVPL